MKPSQPQTKPQTGLKTNEKCVGTDFFHNPIIERANGTKYKIIQRKGEPNETVEMEEN